MDERHDDRQTAQGDIATDAKASDVTPSSQPVPSHKRQDVIAACGLMALIAGICLYLIASQGAYIDASGMLHESLATLVVSKILVLAGIVCEASALVIARRREQQVDHRPNGKS